MRGGRRFRAAVGLSVGLHLLLAAGMVLLGRWAATRPDEPARAVGIDTRVDVTIRLTEPEVDPPTPVVVEEPGDSRPPPAKTEPDTPTDPPEAPTVADSGAPRPPLADNHETASRPPLVRTTPRPLPPELLALMRKPPAPAVTEMPLALPPIRSAPPFSPGPVRPAATAVTAKPSPLEGGRPVHGTLPAGRTVVYALDVSGSMGEHGKFLLARRALAATLRRQPETAQFQVVVYARTASPPLPTGTGRCVPATALNVERMADVLAALGDPAGGSDHAAGLRAALLLEPDVVVFLTDADGPPPAAFRELIRRHSPRPAVCVARVTAGGLAPAVEWK